MDAVQFVQGAASLWSYSAATTTSRTWIFTCASTSVTDKVIYFWFSLGSVAWLNLKSAGGLKLRIESSATDYGEWYVAGKDTLPHNGFICHAVHTSQAFDVSGGTVNKAAINKVTITALGSFPGKAYLWLDALRNGTYLQIKGGTSSVPAKMQDLTDAEETTANRYGVLSKAGGIYFIQGQLLIGSTTAAEDTYFKDTSQVVVFKNALITSGFYEIKVQGNSTATTQKVFFGNKSGTAGIQGISFRCESATQTPKFKFTATDTYVTDLGVYGSGFVAADTISLPPYSATREVLNTSFESCAEVLPNTCTLTNCNFISSPAEACRISSTSHNVTSSNFISCSRGTHIPNIGTYTFNALKFSSCTYDIKNSSAGLVTVNATNGSNVSTYENTGGGSTTINNTVTLEINGVSNGTRCRIEKTSDGTALLSGTATTLDDTGVTYKATAQWNYVASTQVRVKARLAGYLPFQSTTTIPTAGLTVTAVWQSDLNYVP